MALGLARRLGRRRAHHGARAQAGGPRRAGPRRLLLRGGRGPGPRRDRRPGARLQRARRRPAREGPDDRLPARRHDRDAQGRRRDGARHDDPAGRGGPRRRRGGADAPTIADPGAGDEGGVAPARRASSATATRSWARSARAAWASSTARATASSTRWWRSSCCGPRRSRPTRRSSSASSRRSSSPGASRTGTCCAPTTSARPAGVPYISMEYLEGVTLKDLVRSRGALPLGVGLSIAKQMCHGLGAAHETGVVHRDIKPQNMLILPETGELKIMDFGISRVSSVEPGTSGLTTAGHRDGHARLHAARAGAGQAGRLPLRHLLARGRVLRDLHRQAAVQGRDPDGGGGGPHPAAAAAAAQRQPEAAAGARGADPEGPRQGPGASAGRRPTSCSKRSPRSRRSRSRRRA